MAQLTPVTRRALRKTDLREANERLILNLIRQNPEVSRADLVNLTGLSASSVTFIVKRLIGENLLLETRNGQVQSGRPPISLRLRPEAMYVVGTEISTSRTRVASADVDGQILNQKTVPWHNNPEVFLVRVRRAIAGMIQKYPQRRLLGVGVGIPGTIDRATGHVVAAENLGWFDLDAGRLVSEGIPSRFFFENDAKLAAFAERWFCGPGDRPPQDFVFVASRGGIGTGVFVDGRLLQGSHGEASEFGHTILFPDGRPCPCGNRGCWEQYASDRALERLYASHHPAAGLTSAEEIVRRARCGEGSAVNSLREIAVYVGLGFVNLKVVFSPEIIILGNYLAAAWDLISEVVWNVLRERMAPRYLSHLQIVPARYAEDSTLIGAFGLVLSRFFTPFDVASQAASRP